MSAAYGASTEETQKLLAFARTDKLTDGSIVPTYAQDRTLAHAYISLFFSASLRKEEICVDMLRDLKRDIQSRV